MPTQTQPWLRAELIAAPETTPGAQLMIPADGVEFHDDQLVFHRQGEIVYVAGRGQLRSITWFAKQPNPESARRKAQWPNHGTRWTDEEREDLLCRLRAGQPWKTISTAHGRSRTGCQQEAVKQGWLDPESLQLKPELLLAPDSPAAAANPEAPPRSPSPDKPAIAASTTTSAPPRTTNTTTPSPPLTTTTATSAPSLAASPRADPAESLPAPAGTLTAEAAPARHAAPTTSTHAPADPAPSSTTDFKARTPSAPPPPDQFSDLLPPDTASIGKLPDPLTSNATMPNSDLPRFPPRIPRQRADSPFDFDSDSNSDSNGSHTNPGSHSSPDPGSGPDSDPRPGSRFLSRAQSSLARATLGAYMSPPRSQSGASSGAT